MAIFIMGLSVCLGTPFVGVLKETPTLSGCPQKNHWVIKWVSLVGFGFGSKLLPGRGSLSSPLGWSCRRLRQPILVDSLELSLDLASST